MPKMNIQDLNQLYTEAEDCDKDLFAEQRSNILLVAGEHYTRRNSRFWSRIRDAKQLNQEQKLRLTKNHIQKITKAYVNAILSHAPGTVIVPANEKELKDQKAAELHNSVWADIKYRHQIKKKIAQFAHDFIEVGECIAKIFYDPSGGQLVGFEAEMIEDPMTGGMVPLTDETGQMVPSSTPVFSGDLVFERIHGFNLLRWPSAKSMDEFGCIYRKMSKIEDLKAMIDSREDLSPEEKEEKKKLVQQSDTDVYTVFDGNSGSYNKVKGMAMVREFYYRPCIDYPKGYFWITTENGVIFEGELPFGIFPIIYEGFDEIQTTPRHRSIIKVLRPFQAEINRAASKIAETQITLGDDKILYQSGAKITNGSQLPGVRGIMYTGAPPTILSGRGGEQYLAYMQSQIDEMYKVSNVFEEQEVKVDGQVDPYALLFKSLIHKKKFSIYGEKFENFILNLTKTALQIKKEYAKEEELIPVLGKKEYINIAEFKNSEDISYQIKVEPISDDIHSQMGKQLIFNNILQYVGGQLDKDSIGMIIKQMPWITKDAAFSDLTIDYDNATSDILALDRGIYRPAKPYDNHKYIIKRLTKRMKESDFDQLPQEIQTIYQQKLKEHEKVEADQQKQIQAAKDGYIPSTGYLVTLDFYVPDPSSPQKTRRARLPYDSIKWLIERLETQGMAQRDLENMNQGALSDMATMLVQDKLRTAVQ